MDTGQRYGSSRRRAIRQAGFLLLLTAASSSPGPAQAMESEVRVELFKAAEPLSRVFISGPLIVQTHSRMSLEHGLYVLTTHQGKIVLSRAEDTGDKILLSANTVLLRSSGPFIFTGTKKNGLRPYRGSLSVACKNKSVLLQNRVAMKDYICSVLGSETLPEFPPEALKAQSILIQTMMARYKAGDYLNDSTETQAYSGAKYERPAVREAVRQTWGQTLICGRQPISVYFHSTCAGSTSTVELFGKTEKACACQKAVKCNYCKSSPFWKRLNHAIPEDLFLKNFPEGLPQLTRKDHSGRPLELEYPGSGRKISGYQFWLEIGQKLGWDKMPGTRFELSRSTNGEILLNSNGAGHGIGLCQWGAAGMARQGKKAKEILKFYFPGSSLRHSKAGGYE